MAAEDDMVLVSASFPTMVNQFSVSNMDVADDAPQAYPTFTDF
jgi:hypothetical protein